MKPYDIFVRVWNGRADWRRFENVQILSNLTLVYTTLGRYEEAIQLGCRSIELGKTKRHQPELVTAYVTL